MSIQCLRVCLRPICALLIRSGTRGTRMASIASINRVRDTLITGVSDGGFRDLVLRVRHPSHCVASAQISTQSRNSKRTACEVRSLFLAGQLPESFNPSSTCSIASKSALAPPRADEKTRGNEAHNNGKGHVKDVSGSTMRRRPGMLGPAPIERRDWSGSENDPRPVTPVCSRRGDWLFGFVFPQSRGS